MSSFAAADIMWAAMAAPDEPGMQPQPMGNWSSFFFFAAFVLVVAYTLLNLYIGKSQAQLPPAAKLALHSQLYATFIRGSFLCSSLVLWHCTNRNHRAIHSVNASRTRPAMLC
jgi:hypothetical protein